MLNNDVLRSLRYLLDLPDAHLAELAAPFGEQVEADLLEAYLKKEDEDGFQACPDRYLARCLDGLIIQRRGGGGGGGRTHTRRPEGGKTKTKKKTGGGAGTERGQH
ncbi:DUF1456 family protein, partial [Pseudomonas aeruginosa]|uniref:DUF1456 family protein n=1 Tax=Pseudomonas aeruginosa TaxID=287 RepID=UPI0021F0BE5B